MRPLIIGILVFIGLFVNSVASVSAYYNYMSANLVLGQPDFTSNSANQGGTAGSRTLRGPTGVLVYQNRLIVSDTLNNRILIWNSFPNANTASADVVIGQQNLNSVAANQGGSANANTLSAPRGLTVCAGKLIVADRVNNRVLIYNQVPSTNNVSANVVIGQPNFTSTSAHQGGGTPNINTLFQPAAVLCIGEKLLIADQGDRRILVYNTIPTTNDASADVVIGQPNFTATLSECGANRVRFSGGAGGLATDGTKLIVSAGTDNAVKIFNSVPTVNNASADVIIGQTSFSSCSANQGGSVAANTISGTKYLAYDGVRLYVADSGNNRVLIYNSLPTSNNASADIVIGQPDFTTGSVAASVAANNFSSSEVNDLFLYDNKLIAADYGNNRVLIFPNTLATPQIQLNGTEPAPGGKVQMNGSIVLGNTPTYGLARAQASMNGSGYQDLTNIGTPQNIGSGPNGTGQTYYPFFHQFQPWENNTPQESWEDRGYTLKFKTVNTNAEENYQFYMNPLTLNSANSTSIPTLRFTVPKTQWERIKENISGFSALVAPIPTKPTQQGANDPNLIWTNYTGNVPTSDMSFDSSGVVTFTARPQAGLTLKGGKYYIRVQANDKWGHNQQSNTMETTLNDVVGNAQPYNPLGLPIVSSHIWFPLQVNKITGVNTGGIISTNNPNSIKASYVSSLSTPTFTGIANSGATVAMNVTNSKTGETKTYTTQAVNSSWTIKPTLPSNSVVNLSVYNQTGLYNELLPLVFTMAPN